MAIDSDPAIAAKLIRVANSAMYAGSDPVDTTSGALVRLGWSTTRQLVTSFAMREMFNTDSASLKRRMQKLWRHSIEIAATCFVVAGKTRQFEPETALLAGLLENVGAIAVITYARKYPEITARPTELERVIETLHPRVGNMMLRSWGLPENVALVPLESRDWYRAPTRAPDYCCLVLFANLLHRLSQQPRPDMPPIHELPCLSGLGLGEITLESVLALAESTKTQICKMRTLLGA